MEGLADARLGMLSCALLVLACSARAASPPVLPTSTDFAGGLEGWHNGGRGEVAPALAPPELSPSGAAADAEPYVRFVDRFGGYSYIIAPPGYLGDWSAFDGLGSILWEHRLFTTGAVQAFAPYSVRLAGPGGAAVWTGPAPTGPTGWVELAAPIREEAWDLLRGTWPGLLAEVSHFAISIEQVANTGALGAETAGIRRVALVPGPGAGAGLILLCALHRPRRPPR